jgi:hypothetical protein
MYYGIFFTIWIALNLLIIRKSIFCFPDKQSQKYVIIIGSICIIILCIYGLILSRQLL